MYDCLQFNFLNFESHPSPDAFLACSAQHGTQSLAKGNFDRVTIVLPRYYFKKLYITLVRFLCLCPAACRPPPFILCIASVEKNNVDGEERKDNTDVAR